MTMLPSLAAAQRLVVKIGSALVVDPAEAAPRAAWLDGVARRHRGVARAGVEVIAVSSGAIALARRTLGFAHKRLRLEEKQAAASVGQIRLAQAWSEALSAHGLTAAQLLLTLGRHGGPQALPQRARDAAHAARARLRSGHQRERFRGHDGNPVRRQRPSRGARGRNDGGGSARPALRRGRPLHGRPPPRSGRRAHSACRGGHTRDRGDGRRAAARLLVRRHADQARRGPDSDAGGLRDGDRARPHGPAAARIAGRCALHLVPACARRPFRAQAMDRGRACAARRVRVDAGAAQALAERPLAAARGVRTVEGSFERGDPVIVRGPDGIPLAHGLSAYSHADARRIAGHRSDEIEALLGWRGRDEIIHRDDLVLL